MALQLGWASSHRNKHQDKHGLSGRSPACYWSLTERAAVEAGWGNSAAAAAADARCTSEAGQGEELWAAAKHGAESPGPVCAGHHQGYSSFSDQSCACRSTPEASCGLGASCPVQAGALLAGKDILVGRCGPSYGGEEASMGCA